MAIKELTRDKTGNNDNDLGKPSRDSFSSQAVGKASEIRQKMSKSTKFKLKILASILMFGSLFFFGKVDLHKTWEVALHTNIWILGATAVFFLFSFVPMARRWQLLSTALGFRKPLLDLLRFYFVGVFFNLFLPSTVGGDVSRCYYLSKGTGNYKESFYSVLADRTSGIAVLFLTATLGVLLSPGASSLPWQLKWPIFAGTFATFVLVPSMPWLTRKILGENNWLTRRFNDSAVKVFWQDRQVVFQAFFWSILSQIVIVVCHIGVGLSLGLIDIPLWYYFVFYPAVAVLGFVTPSFNGIGVREWAYTYLLMMVGVDRSHALTYALIWLGLTTFSSLVGGIVYLASHMSPPPKELDQAQPVA